MTQEQKQLYTEISPFEDMRQYMKGDWTKVSEIIHDEMQIKGFFGNYSFLSNFGNAPVVLDGMTYTSTERAYQAAKWKPEDRAFFQTCTNEEAITYNRDENNTPNMYTAEDWDAIKLDVMGFLLVQKFDPEQNPDFSRKLLATGDKYLEETNWWGDTFWGKTLAGQGQNNLGQLLMAIRADLAVQES